MIQSHFALANCLIALSVCRIETARADENPIAIPRLEIIQRTAEPLLRADKPWEDFCLGYCQVLRTDGRWQMWYGSYDHNYRDDSDGFLCYARSADGIHWDKPEMGLVTYDGSRRNNIILDGGVHGACVFVDPKASPGERFKMAFVKRIDNRWPVFGGTSPDGIHWTLADKPLLNHNSDTQQTCFRDGDGYRLYLRMWSGPADFAGHRLVGHSYSATFGQFAAPQAILQADENDPANMQFYNSAVTKLRDGLYIMFPSGFYTGEDVVRVHAAVGHDGEHFHRIGQRPLLDLGQGFDRMALYVGPGAVATEKPDKFWVYYVGNDTGHDRVSPAKVKYGGGIGRFLLSIKE